MNELRERTRDLQESLEYQTATSDMLKVIRQSTSDLQPVLEIVIKTAARLCEADFAYMFRQREGHHRLVASRALIPEFRDFLLANPFVPDRSTLSGRVAIERSLGRLRRCRRAFPFEYPLARVSQALESRLRQ